MKLIDERHQIREVATRWKQQYCHSDGSWSNLCGGESAGIYDKLIALDPETAVANDVAAIIGNNSWAGPSECHECGETVARTVEIGQPPDYESHTAQLCEKCIRNALALFQQR